MISGATQNGICVFKTSDGSQIFDPGRRKKIPEWLMIPTENERLWLWWRSMRRCDVIKSALNRTYSWTWWSRMRSRGSPHWVCALHVYRLQPFCILVVSLMGEGSEFSVCHRWGQINNKEWVLLRDNEENVVCLFDYWFLIDVLHCNHCRLIPHSGGIGYVR